MFFKFRVTKSGGGGGVDRDNFTTQFLRRV